MLHHEIKRLPVTRSTMYMYIDCSVVYSNVRDVTGKIGMDVGKKFYRFS